MLLTKAVRRNLPTWLNHLFQTAEKGTVEEYAVIEETISPAVLQKISDWLSATLAPEAVSPK